MDDIEILRAKIEQLQLLIDSILQERMIGGANVGGMAGPGNFAMPVLGDEGSEKPGPFEIESLGTDSISMRDRYYRVGGKTYEAADNAPRGEGILCLEVDATTSVPQASYAVYETLSDLQNEEEDESKYIVPLYTFNEKGEITLDWRKGANLSMGEF